MLLCNYNHSKYIGEAIQSFLDQTLPADEIVVIDDGSTDNSLEVLRPLAGAGYIRLIALPQNVGVTRAFARGLEEVKGEYMLALAADDKSLPNFFEHVLGLLEKHPHAPFGVGCIHEWFPDGVSRLELPAHQKVTMRAMPGPTYVSPATTFNLERSHVPSGLMGYGAVFRTELMRQIMADVGNAGHLIDWFVMRVMAFRAGYCFLPEVVMHRRNLAGSISDGATRHWPVRKQACLEVLRLLNLPAYADVKPQFRESGALAVGGYRAVLMLLCEPRYWEYVNRPLLFKGILNFVASVMPVGWKSALRALQRV